jgi:DNA-binding response OmpR family regulator
LTFLSGEARNIGLAAGMNDFLTKPVLARQLLEVVQRWILRARETQFGPSTRVRRAVAQGRRADQRLAGNARAPSQIDTRCGAAIRRSPIKNTSATS